MESVSHCRIRLPLPVLDLAALLMATTPPVPLSSTHVPTEAKGISEELKGGRSETSRHPSSELMLSPARKGFVLFHSIEKPWNPMRETVNLSDAHKTEPL